MAEDTRLAEACLLLNYSSQSYREQMLLNRNLQNNLSNSNNNQQASGEAIVETKFETNAQQQQQQVLNSSEPITPPPEHEVCSHTIDNPSSTERCNTGKGDGEEEVFTPDQIKRDPIEEVTHFNKIDSTLSISTQLIPAPTTITTNTVPHKIPNDCYFSSYNKNPINNLLAVVNCAMPGIKNRPNILQRTTSNPHQHTMFNNDRQPIKSSTGALSISDHDYCQTDDTLSPSAYHSDGFVDVLKHHYQHQSQHQHYTDQYSNSSKQQPKFNYNQRSKRYSPDNPNASISKRKQKHSSSVSSLSNNLKKPLKLVAIHLGAGNSHNELEALPLAKSICEEVMLQTNLSNADFSRQPLSCKKKRNKSSIYLKSQDNLAQTSECHDHHEFDDCNEILNAETAVVRLIKLMEDSQLLNCGYGSNLNIKGQVECDASLMSDKSQMWTGVGAVSGCKNPILLAKSLYDHRTIARPLGLIQPNILVGSGAKQWMREHCPHLSVIDSKMISSRSFSAYQKFKSKYDIALKSLKQHKLEGKSILESGNLNQDYLYVANETVNNMVSPFCKPPSADGSSASFIATSFIDDSNHNFHTTSPTALDHGFYCIKTRDNLRRVSSFASVDEMLEGKKRFTNTTNTKVSQCETDVHIDIEFQEETCYNDSTRLDTVGAVAVDCDNNFASAISSGGLLLKYKGRVGQAAIPGAGCWAENSVAVTTTGVGEYLTLNLFAKKFYDKILTLRLLYDLGHVEKGSNATSTQVTTDAVNCNEDLSNLISCAMEECFEELIRSPALIHVPVQERLAGMLSVSTINSKDSPKRVDGRDDLYMSFGHNTRSMCVGYMTCNDIVAHSFMSKQQQQSNDEKGGCKVTVKTIKFLLDPDKHADGYPSNCNSGDIRNSNNKNIENTTSIIKIETDSMNQSV